MNHLFVFYDRDCSLCTKLRAWIDLQPKTVPLRFVAYQDPEALRLCPALPELDPDKEIVVLADNGDIYTGGDAWIVCLHALERFRPWAEHLARPALRPLAKRACILISENRLTLSWLLSLKSDASLAITITEYPPLQKKRPAANRATGHE